ncbi:MAG: hypothetical protein H0T73_04050 [Ardenticatenales bacterium]|nr:hypothetical protein [Ardenticatenales bacterium]
MKQLLPTLALAVVLAGCRGEAVGPETGSLATPTTLEPSPPTALTQNTPLAEETAVTIESPTLAPAATGAADSTSVPVALPIYLSTELKDVRTEESFRISELTGAGNYVLVETMAVWCTTCLRQQRQIQAFEEDGPEDVVSVALDIDINETTELLISHTERNGFDWLYAIAPPDLSRAIGEDFGQQFLNPPNAPMLLVRPDNSIVPLPFGVKEAADLAAFVTANRLP